jgi:sugar O-acyltransferase (sialic acid O-acetyltransferase NeuD family)
MTDLVIYGVGPFAELMHYYFTHDSGYRVVAFTADAEFLKETMFCGLPVVPFETVAAAYTPDAARMFVAIGYKRMRNRRILFDRAKAHGYTLVNYISSRAISFPNFQIGENNVAMGKVHFEPFVKVGNNNMFWSDTLVCHGVTVGDDNYMGAKCLLAGNSTIENGCFLGNATVLIDGLTVRRESHVVAGSAIFRSTKEFHKYMGNPAQVIGTHAETGIVIERG